MSNEIDVVVAAGERALDVAGIEGIEKSHNVLTVNILDHIGSAGVNPTRIVDCIVNGIARRSIGKKTEPGSAPRSRGALQPMVARQPRAILPRAMPLQHPVRNQR
jgi:hypothetical protein